MNFTVLQIGKVIFFFSTSSWGAWHSRNWEICNHRFLERNLLKERWKSETRKKYTRGFDLMKVDRKYEKSFFNFLIFYRTPKLVLLDKKKLGWTYSKNHKTYLIPIKSWFKSLDIEFCLRILDLLKTSYVIKKFHSIVKIETWISLTKR